MTYLTAGDHIVTNIDVLCLTEYHGLYIGNDEVIHLTESEARVVKTSLYSFLMEMTYALNALQIIRMKQLKKRKTLLGMVAITCFTITANSSLIIVSLVNALQIK